MMAAREHNEIEIRDDDEGRGAILSFPFDAALVERFREAFPRARWSDQLSAWKLPGTTAMLRAARWLDRELPKAFTLADQRGRDAFAFEPIVSPYLEATDEIVVRTPYLRTVIKELRAVPWAWWNGEDKAWHVSLPPPDRVLMSHEGPLIVLEVTGEVVPAETAHRHYPWSSGQSDDLVWALWRRPTFEELVKAWPARRQTAPGAFLRGWWQPTLAELGTARRAARSLERAQETRRTRRSSGV